VADDDEEEEEDEPSSTLVASATRCRGELGNEGAGPPR